MLGPLLDDTNVRIVTQGHSFKPTFDTILLSRLSGKELCSLTCLIVSQNIREFTHVSKHRYFLLVLALVFLTFYFCLSPLQPLQKGLIFIRYSLELFLSEISVQRPSIAPKRSCWRWGSDSWWSLHSWVKNFGDFVACHNWGIHQVSWPCCWKITLYL